MMLRRALPLAVTVDHLAGVAAAGRTQRHGHSAVLAAAWIETLHNRAERRAERHVRAA